MRFRFGEEPKEGVMSNRTKQAVVSALVVATLAGGVVGMAQGFGGGRWRDTSGDPSLPGEVAEALLEALVGPDGEYAAYALYSAVIDKHGPVQPYATIRDSEARHIVALQRQLDKYGIDYPTENPYLGRVEAPEDLQEAALAWVDGEIANIEMYDLFLEVVKDYPEITRVFANLRRASLESHLPAFQVAAERGGVLEGRAGRAACDGCSSTCGDEEGRCDRQRQVGRSRCRH